MNKKISETLALHIIAVYKAMEEDSIEENGIRVYTGKLAELVSSLGISSTWYSKIFRALYDGGYAALEDRGGRNKPSTVVLIRPPTQDELQGLTMLDGGPIISLVKRIESLENSLGGMYVAGALREVERRLTALEDTEAARSKGGR